MTSVNTVLDKIVSTQHVFYTRLHQFHWYVKGPDFFDLHVKFEELYDAVTVDMDEVAERLLTVGGSPSATFSEFTENSVISENVEDKHLSAVEMAEAFVADLKAYTELLKEGIELTDEAGDDVSNDMLIAIRANMDKQIWMLQAFLDSKTNVQA